MKIAITGAKGFIGTRLGNDLKANGHEVVGIDVEGNTPIDIMDVEALSAACAGCDAIYHLAAAHRDDIFPRSIYYDVNVEGTRNVLKAAAVNNISRVIFTSSFAVYGLDSGTPSEDTKPEPFNDYGKSKLEAEKVIEQWHEDNFDKTVTIVRPVVVFGEGNRGNVYTLINQVAGGRFIMIGNGQNKKSMAYVGNVVDFLKFCLDRPEGSLEIFNYADKPDFNMAELMEVITSFLGRPTPKISLPYSVGVSAGYAFDVLARITGKQLPISSIRVKKFCADTTCAADKARVSGFKPAYSLKDGVEAMIAHDFPHLICLSNSQESNSRENAA
ncbi:MAG: NAD-dependent epimerase/dehydratase family protein [Alphaproteobacteria bacterium]|nr:NAD-dependent epimerase/dehydratase family protein [Alphaproteobacteria bacterium]